MELVVQLVLAIAVFGVTLSGGSLIWPKVTDAPRPQLLQQVHDSVIKTQVGSQAAQVLGVSDDGDVQPINLGQVAGNVINGIKSTAQKRAATIIMAQVMGQITDKYENLPQDQQKQRQQIICTPISTTSAVVQ